MKIEILYPEICCLYGDKANMAYLRKCLPQAEFVETNINDEPRFAYEAVDLIYLCSMSEKSQELVIEKLKPFKNILRLLMDEDKCTFLLTGNSFEIFGNYIQKENGEKIEALGLIDTYSVRQCPKRFNTLVLAEGEGTKIVGYTSRFSHTYGITEDNALFKVIKGTGSNPDTMLEGVKKGRLLGTYLIGPLLISNPDFTKHLLKLMGAEEITLSFEDEAVKAYEKRLKDFERPNLVLTQ